MFFNRTLAVTFAAMLLCASVHSADSLGGRTPTSGQPFGFRVKAGERATTKGSPDLSPVLSLFPQKNGRATLVGLTSMTITFNNSFAFTSNIDARGKVSGAFSARLVATNGKLPVVFKDFDVIGIFGVSTATDGIFDTPPILITLTVSDGTTTTTLVDNAPLIITYQVKRGVARATALR
jgi:hypothetical protein